MHYLLSRLAICTPLLLSACTQQVEQVSDLFRPTTSGTAVRVVQGSPIEYKSQPQSTSRKSRGSVASPSGNVHTTKRINTTECNDADDWYLDGYRVGSSFSSQKSQMLQQRMQFCQLSQLPSQWQSQWERGFNIGSQERGIRPKANKNKVRKT